MASRAQSLRDLIGHFDGRLGGGFVPSFGNFRAAFIAFAGIVRGKTRGHHSHVGGFFRREIGGGQHFPHRVGTLPLKLHHAAFVLVFEIIEAEGIAASAEEIHLGGQFAHVGSGTHPCIDECGLAFGVAVIAEIPVALAHLAVEVKACPIGRAEFELMPSGVLGEQGTRPRDGILLRRAAFDRRAFAEIEAQRAVFALSNLFDFLFIPSDWKYCAASPRPSPGATVLAKLPSQSAIDS